MDNAKDVHVHAHKRQQGEGQNLKSFTSAKASLDKDENLCTVESYLGSFARQYFKKKT